MVDDYLLCEFGEGEQITSKGDIFKISIARRGHFTSGATTCRPHTSPLIVQLPTVASFDWRDWQTTYVKKHLARTVERYSGS